MMSPTPDKETAEPNMAEPNMAEPNMAEPNMADSDMADSDMADSDMADSDMADSTAPSFWDEPEVGDVFGSLESARSDSGSRAPQSVWDPDPGGTGVQINVGGVPVGTAGPVNTYMWQPVFLECTDAETSYQCRLIIPLGNIDVRAPSGEVSTFPDLSGEELRALVVQAQATLPQLQALITADFLTQWGTNPGTQTQHGKSLHESAFSDKTLGLWKEDMAPFAAKHPSCRAAIKQVEEALEFRGFKFQKGTWAKARGNGSS